MTAQRRWHCKECGVLWSGDDPVCWNDSAHVLEEPSYPTVDGTLFAHLVPPPMYLPGQEW